MKLGATLARCGRHVGKEKEDEERERRREGGGGGRNG